MRRWGVVFLSLGILMGCHGVEAKRGLGSQVGSPNLTPKETPPPPSSNGDVGESCKSQDPSFLCLGLKYVVYKDEDNVPVVTSKQAASNVRAMNAVWKKCKIAFQIDQYLDAKPSDYKLQFNPEEDTELDDARKAFETNEMLLVITTGKWDRSGSLGDTGANAWTAMPGNDLYGVVLESPVGRYPNIIAHELGHYLNLYHKEDSSNLMNPIIYDDSTELKEAQCEKSRAAISKYWAAMKR